jgi:hypothetical protein
LKLLSLSSAAVDARKTFGRFPFVLVDAVVGTACALILIDHEGPPQPTFLFQVIFGAVLGFPLLAGLAILSEKRKLNKAASMGIQVAGMIIIALYAFSVPQELSGAPNFHMVRLLVLTAGLIVFAFAAPYFGHKSELGYWNYCRTLVLRILTAYLYTVVLWVGLAIALAALDNLFGVNVPGKRYGELWVLINGVFTAWFFLSGIPDDLDSLDAVDDYPKGLKIFSQYILLPLVFIYLVILYTYLGKILLAWEWPEGWVSKLILGFIGTGIVSTLLLHPIKERTENVWIKILSRWFYVIVIPLLIMLFFAVWRRVSEYGITEGRYLAIATGMWLCVIVLYYIVSGRKSIRFLPTSLFIALFVVGFGPWGMFSVSEKSQISRLKELLTNNHVLVDGRVVSKHDSVRFDATKQISSIVSYLSEMHGFDGIQPWFGESLKNDHDANKSTYKDAARVTKMMGIEYIRTWQNPVGGMTILTADREGAFALDGYDFLLHTQHGYSGATRKEFPDQGVSYRIGKDLDTITMFFAHSANEVDSLQIDLQPLVKKVSSDYGNASTDRIPVEKMTIVASSQRTKVKLWFPMIRVQRSRGESKVVSYEFDIAYKLISEK